jgi:hypothetical protein
MLDDFLGRRAQINTPSNDQEVEGYRYRFVAGVVVLGNVVGKVVRACFSNVNQTVLVGLGRESSR